MKERLIRFLPAGMALLTLALAAPAHAQISGDTSNLRLSIFNGDFWQAVQLLFQFFLLAAGLIAFLFVLYGGFLYLTAGGDPARAGQGRTYIINALIGIIIIFVSYALVRLVITQTRTGKEFKFSNAPLVIDRA